jgi:hypothetical protein
LSAKAASSDAPPLPPAAELPDGTAPSPFGSGPRPAPPEPDSATAKSSSERELEGGVGFATSVEVWSDSMLLGPRIDVGVAMGKGLAFVIGEGARFGFGSPDLGQVMVFDLQAGVGYGAPYQARRAFGLLALLGAERLAISSGRFAEGGVWTWTATATLGARASLDLGPIDMWLGVEGMLRSKTIKTDGASGVSIPDLAGIVSLGGFLPAFSRTAAPASASRAPHRL